MTATQQCSECSSPLRPCKCNRAARKPKRLKTRSYRKVHAHNPLVYGRIYDRVKMAASNGECILKGTVDAKNERRHVCGDVWRSTAHHSPHVGSGGDDRRCAPVCGAADDMMHSRMWGWTEGEVHARFGVDVRDKCEEWGARAIAEEFGDDLPSWLTEKASDTDRLVS